MNKNENERGLAPLRAGFTLVEILVVIVIIGILMAIILPAAGSARKASLRRRAAMEMSSIKVAVLQFQSDHRYMPWPPIGSKGLRVGDDMWATDAATQAPVMDLLTGNNPIKKNYLQIPEKSRPADKSMVFNDPWGQPYQIGLDRNMDGQVEVKAVFKPTAQADWNGKLVMERVLVVSQGETEPMKSFDDPN